MSAQRPARITTVVPTCTGVPSLRPIPVRPPHDRYADLTDHRLAAALSTEDLAEQRGMNPLERITCRIHRRWLHHCISSPVHVIVVTGHRWCRRCACAVSIAVDELTGDIRLTCPRCTQTPDTAATRRIVRCCRASIAAAAEPPSDQGLTDSLRRRHSGRPRP